MKRVTNLLVLIFYFNAIAQVSPQTYDTIEQSFARDGLTVISEGGIAQCMRSWCWASRQIIDPKTSLRYTQMYKGYQPRGGSALDVAFQSEGEPIAEMGVVEVNGERVGYTMNSDNGSHTVAMGESALEAKHLNRIPENQRPKMKNDSNGTRVSSKDGNPVTNPAEQNQSQQATNNTSGEFWGRMAFAVFSSFATIGRVPDNEIELKNNIRKVESELQQAQFNVQQINRASAQLLAMGVNIPAATRANISLGGMPPAPIIQLSSPSEVREFHIENRSELAGLENDFASRDAAKIAQNSELITSLYAKQNELSSIVEPFMNTEGVIVPSKIDPTFGEAPFDNYDLETYSGSPYGRLVRRAIHKTQLAWGQLQKQGYNVAEKNPALVGSSILLKVADARFLGTVNDALLKQAEAMVYVAEKVAEASLGFSQGAGDTLLGMADAIQAMPEIGKKLYNFGKTAVRDPKLAGQQMWDVLEATPEVAEQIWGALAEQAKGFDKLPLQEQARLIGRISSEVAVSIVGPGALIRGAKTVVAAEKATVALEKTINFTNRAIRPYGLRSQQRLQKLAKFASGPPGKLGNKFSKTWGELTDEYKSAYSKGLIWQAKGEVNLILVQVEGVGQTVPGRWFTFRGPKTAAEAEKLLYIKKYKPQGLSGAKFYRVKEEFAGYYGHVDNGLGKQLFIPEDIPLSEVLEEIPDAYIKFPHPH